MLRRVLYAVAAIIAIVAIAVAVLPYFVGRQAESSFKYQVASFNASHSAVALHVDEYQRGFYASEADVTLSGETQDENHSFGLVFGTGATARFHIRINHGPIPFASFGGGRVNFTPVLYTAEFRGENLPPLSFLGALKPDVHLVQYFNGATTTHVVLPPGRFGLGAVGAIWQGGEATLHLNAARDRADYEGTIKPINFQFLVADSGATYNGILKGIEFSGTGHKGEHDFWVGRGTNRYGGLVVTSGGSQIVALADLQNEVVIGESANGLLLNGSSHSVLNGGTIKGWNFSRLTLQGSVAGLDATALRRGFDALRTQADQTSKGVTAAQARTVMGNALAPAVTSATIAALSLTLAAPSGSARFAAHIGFTAPPGGTTAGASSTPVARAVGQGNLAFDQKLVDDFVAKVVNPILPLVVDQSLKSLVTQGYLTQTPGGGYRALIGYRAGVLTINGRTVNPASEP
ncbi:MAG: DUF945 family protein [Gammaproteobacteria bacterium]